MNRNIGDCILDLVIGKKEKTASIALMGTEICTQSAVGRQRNSGKANKNTIESSRS